MLRPTDFTFSNNFQVKCSRRWIALWFHKKEIKVFFLLPPFRVFGFGKLSLDSRPEERDSNPATGA